MKTRKYLSFFIVLALILTTIVGCGKEDSKVETSTQSQGNGEEIDSEQYLNLVLNAEPSTLDPSKGADSYSNSILTNVMEPLTRLEEDEALNNFVAPAGAESWEHSEDGTIWTFKIRDANWSDGEPVKAQDYEYGIKRSIAQDTASPYAYLLNPIKNAVKANSGELSIDEVGVKALDDKTLEITLEGPTPHFLSLTYQRVMLPQRQDIVEKYGDKYGSELDTIVYNGPFILSNWVHNSEIILTKNENYWDKDRVELKNINLKIIQDENAIYNSLANGSIDIASTNKPEWKEKFMKDDRLDHQEVVSPQTFFIFFNTQDEVFKNTNIRKAFSIAINREELANVIFHGVHMPAYGWVSPSISIGEDEYRTIVEGPVKQLIDENPDAEALLSKGLEELGMDPDPANLTVKIAFGGTDQWFRTYGEYLQEMYNKLLGVNIEIELFEWPVFSAAVGKGDFQVSYMAWGAEYNDPLCMLSLLQSDANAIATGWVNEKYDELIDLAAKEMEQEKRLEYFKEAERLLLYDEAVLAPVVYPRRNVFSYKYIHDLGVTPFETQGYKYGYTQGR